MPPLSKPATADAADLRASKLRVLRALADGGSYSRRAIGARCGGEPGGDLLGEMEAAGLIAGDALDMDGGVVERVWAITSRGLSLLNGSASSTKPPDAPRQGRLVPWFGANTAGAAAVAEQCKGCVRVMIPFAGSLAEVPAILGAGVRGVTCNDKHRHLINLCRVMADPLEGARLFRRLRRQPFDQDVLALSQRYCRERLPLAGAVGGKVVHDFDAAFHYFIAVWFGRGGQAGTKGEFNGRLAARWKGAGSGGESSVRFSGAVWSIRDWRKILERCTFWSEDAFVFLDRCSDDEGTAAYLDPPWLDAGKGYLHNFGDDEVKFHARLAARLDMFQKARVIVRTGGGAVYDACYPKDRWRWLACSTRNQGNVEKVEWLIVKNGVK